MSKFLSTYKIHLIAITTGLFALLAVVVLLEIVPRGEQMPEPSIKFISSSEAGIKISEYPDAFIIDVRTNMEFVHLRIPGSINIPYTSIAQMQELLPYDRRIPIFLYCRTGRRAGIAANVLLELGFQNIFVFPGMIDWQGDTITG